MSTSHIHIETATKTNARPTQTLMTPHEVADLLRTSRKAIYAMAEKDALPGVTRIGRRVLFRSDVLLDWLRQKSSSSLER